MSGTLLEKNNFRKLYVLGLAVGISIIFLRMIGAFLETLVLAAVFSGMVYPLFKMIEKRFHGHAALASATTLVIVLLLIILPLLAFLGVVTAQALKVTEIVRPWVEQRVQDGGIDWRLPSWFPFIDYIEPHRDEIIAKLGQFASKTGGFLVGSLSKVTQGTVTFFLQLFIMLYAMFFFLMGGPQITNTLFAYVPLSRTNKQIIFDKGVSITRATLKGTFIIGALQGALAGIAFAVAGVQGAAFWGTVMAVLSVIPGIGAALIWIPAVIFLYATGENVAATGLALWCAGVVGAVDNVLRPKLVGGDTKMPDLLILLSTLGGIGMFGASGIILGPVIAGLFLTVWDIFVMAFHDELPDAPPLIPAPGSAEPETGDSR
jgi:predicted PurR-regulated permease PerM